MKQRNQNSKRRPYLRVAYPSAEDTLDVYLK